MGKETEFARHGSGWTIVTEVHADPNASNVNLDTDGNSVASTLDADAGLCNVSQSNTDISGVEL